MCPHNDYCERREQRYMLHESCASRQKAGSHISFVVHTQRLHDDDSFMAKDLV